MIKTIKKIIPIIVLVLLSGCSNNLGGDLQIVDTVNTKIDKEIADIDKLQDDYIKTNTEYKEIDLHIIKDTDIKSYTYKYMSPGGAGWQTVLEKPDGSQMSYGEGEWKDEWSFDWTPAYKFATTTK